MKKISYCPECENLLTTRIDRCSCGWIREKSSVNAASNNRCQYAIGSCRCPLPGVVCPQPYSNNPWYCSQHWAVFDDIRRGKEVLENAEKNHSEIMRNRQDWRDKLFTQGRKQ